MRRRGELRDQYPGGLEQRRDEIDAGRGPAGGRAGGRRADELGGGGAGHGRAAGRGVGRAVADVPRAWWSRHATPCSRAGARWSSTTATSVLRPVPLPPALVEAWLARELPRLGERTDPAALLAWVIGRGEAPELAPW